MQEMVETVVWPFAGKNIYLWEDLLEEMEDVEVTSFLRWIQD